MPFLAILTGPLGKYIAYAAIAVGLLLAGGVYLHGVKQSGVQQERAAEAAAAQAHVAAVLKSSQAIDAEVVKQADPQSVLKHEWERAE